MVAVEDYRDVDDPFRTPLSEVENEKSNSGQTATVSTTIHQHSQSQQNDEVKRKGVAPPFETKRRGQEKTIALYERTLVLDRSDVVDFAASLSMRA